MIKPAVDQHTVETVLEQHWGSKVSNISAMAGGNLSAVFSFDHDGRGYVIHFSEMKDAFLTESYISNLLSSQGVPYPRIYGMGKHEAFHYSISERMTGSLLADLPHEQKIGLIPDLVEVIVRIKQVKVDSTSGFGWVSAGGNGMYSTWEEYVVDFYKEDQTGNFWDNWHDLFRTSFLEKDVVEECYARLMHYAKYNSPHRHFVHNDCHAWNILSDGRKVTGIIDANPVYGDFLIDVSIVEDMIPGIDLGDSIRERYEQMGIVIPDYAERMKGARYYKGLDGLRFYAKMGRKPSYDHLRSLLLALDK